MKKFHNISNYLIQFSGKNVYWMLLSLQKGISDATIQT